VEAIDRVLWGLTAAGALAVALGQWALIRRLERCVPKGPPGFTPAVPCPQCGCPVTAGGECPSALCDVGGEHDPEGLVPTAVIEPPF
jgi:hypothetical protein